MKTITITLTDEEAKKLSTVINSLNGRLQYRATQTEDTSLDTSWIFWNGICKKIADSLGMIWNCPTKESQDLLNQ